MSKQDKDLPEDLRKSLRALMLDEMGPQTLDDYEIALFDWYVKETEALLKQMLSSEQSYIRDQVEKGTLEINDSGMVAVEYYAKRIRYSHVIYLVSLLESCLERACSKLITAVGPEITPFGPTELKGDQWAKRRQFLERYADLAIAEDLWTTPRMLVSIRNYLVHENGETANVSDEKRKEIKKHPGLDIDGFEFKIEEAYIQHSLDALRLLVDAIEKGIGEAIQKSRLALHSIRG
jgi:hypothetical protein